MYTKEQLVTLSSGLVHACNMVDLLEKYGDPEKAATEKASYLRLLRATKEIYEGIVAKEKIEAEKTAKEKV